MLDITPLGDMTPLSLDENRKRWKEHFGDKTAGIGKDLPDE